MRGLVRTNHAGRPVRAVRGSALVLAAGVAAAVVAVLGADPGRVTTAFLAGWFALGVTGLLDDLYGQGSRGLLGHLRSLGRGRPTTGILKLVAGVAVAVTVAALAGGGALRLGAGVLLIAASVNVWNALDVVPGRCLKWAIVALAGAAPALWGTAVAGVVVTIGAFALMALPIDLGERAMLGDAGSNPLGLAVGTALFLALPTAGVVAAAVAALLLQVAAETVTISRLVDAVPSVRWFDRLGRRPAG